MLLLIGLLSMMGLGSVTFAVNGTMLAGGSATADWYDANDHPVCYRNFTAVSGGEAGTVISGGNHWGDEWYWRNATNTYQIFNAAGGEQPLSDSAINFSAGTALGLIGVVLGIMTLATIVGLKIFGNGISDVSVSAIVKGAGLLALWTVFSAVSMSLIVQIPASLGVVFYFVLTAMYTLGIINQIGHPGGED